jgi:transcriptional regulator with XRE-family HTH domain
MTPAPQIAFAPMSTRDGTLDLRTRQRIAANLRYLQYKNEFVSISAMAKAIGMSRSALTRYLKGERTAGLDVLLLVHRRLHVSIDWLVDREPDACWLDPNYWPLNGVRPLRPVPPAQ